MFILSRLGLQIQRPLCLYSNYLLTYVKYCIIIKLFVTRHQSTLSASLTPFGGGSVPLTLAGYMIALCLMCVPLTLSDAWYIRGYTYSPLKHKGFYQTARRELAICIFTTVMCVITLVVVGDRAPESGNASGWWYLEMLLVILTAFYVALTITVVLCIVRLRPRSCVRRNIQDQLWAWSIRARHFLAHQYGGCNCS